MRSERSCEFVWHSWEKINIKSWPFLGSFGNGAEFVVREVRGWLELQWIYTNSLLRNDESNKVPSCDVNKTHEVIQENVI